jgi:hypothetical protein
MWSVANAGIDGQSTAGMIADLDFWLLEMPALKPRLVLAYVGINDVYKSGSTTVKKVGRKDRGQILRDNLQYSNVTREIEQRSALVRLWTTIVGLIEADRVRLRHRAVDFASARWTDQPAQPVWPPDQLKVNLAAYKDRLERIAGLIESMGAIPVFITQTRADYRLEDGRLTGIVETNGPNGVDRGRALTLFKPPRSKSVGTGTWPASTSRPNCRSARATSTTTSTTRPREPKRSAGGWPASWTGWCRGERLTPGTHERLVAAEAMAVGSNRSFGIVFSVLFAFLGLGPLLRGRPARGWALVVAAVFLVAALTLPRMLAPLHRVWLRFGLVLHACISPVIMGLVFYTTVTPIGSCAAGSARIRSAFVWTGMPSPTGSSASTGPAA